MADRVALTRGGADARRHLGEQLVPGGAAERGVDVAEAVDVNEQDGHARAGGDGRLEPAGERRAVGQG
jgi:hypothetical protein